MPVTSAEPTVQAILLAVIGELDNPTQVDIGTEYLPPNPVRLGKEFPIIFSGEISPDIRISQIHLSDFQGHGFYFHGRYLTQFTGQRTQFIRCHLQDQKNDRHVVIIHGIPHPHEDALRMTVQQFTNLLIGRIPVVDRDRRGVYLFFHKKPIRCVQGMGSGRILRWYFPHPLMLDHSFISGKNRREFRGIYGDKKGELFSQSAFVIIQIQWCYKFIHEMEKVFKILFRFIRSKPLVTTI